LTKTISAVSQAADALRAFALARQDGDFLGSEEELIQRLGVSRPTLRQASAQVVQEHLISIRRGMGGGYFAQRPGSSGVSRIAALYLQSRKASFVEISVAMKSVRADLAMLAPHCTDQALRDELEAMVIKDRDPEHDRSGESHSYRAFLRSERDFGRILGRMSGNSVLVLLLEILYDFAALARREDDVLVNRPERVNAYRKHRAQLGEAILNGDEEISRLASFRCSDLITEWIHEDFNGRVFDGPQERAEG
jgi:DNA-binding FadR family transcriptional regulator